MRFYRSSAAAQRAGFRACKRCRPDASPGSPEWNVRADVVARAMRLIADGVVDREGVAGLAGRLGYSERQLNRLVSAELGAGPLALARAQRAQTARTLIETTELPFADVAFAAGFASIRQFNDTVREVFALTPRELRRGAARRTPAARGRDRAAPAVPRADRARARCSRSSRRARSPASRRSTPAAPTGARCGLPHGAAIAELAPGDGCVQCSLRLADVRDLGVGGRALPPAARPRRRPGRRSTTALGARSAARAARRARGPGCACPGCVDGTEIAVRAVLGQQVSVAARAHARRPRIVQRHGEPLAAPDGALTHRLPDARPRSPRPTTTSSRCRRGGATRCAASCAALADGARRPRRRAPTASAPGATCWRCPASARGRSSTSRCARSATPTRSRPATSASCTRCARSASRPTRARPSGARRPGGRGGPTASCTCGARSRAADDMSATYTTMPSPVGELLLTRRGRRS